MYLDHIYFQAGQFFLGRKTLPHIPLLLSLIDCAKRGMCAHVLTSSSINKHFPSAGEEHTGDGQNNGNTTQYRNTSVCYGCIARTLVVSILRYSFVCLRCAMSVSMHYKLCFVNSPYESTTKWETCKIFK